MSPVLTLFASVIMSASANTDAPNAVESLLASMRRAYSSTESVEIQSTVKNFEANGTSSGRYSFKYQRPNRIRFVADIGRNHVERYSNGTTLVTIANALRSSNTTINVQTLGGRLPGNLEWLCFFDWKRQLSTSQGANMAQSTFKLALDQAWNGRKWTVLEETAKQMNVRVRYFIDPKTFFIWRCDVYGIAQNKMLTQVEVRKLQLGVKLDSSTFRPPP